MRLLFMCLAASAAAFGCGSTGDEPLVSLEEHPGAFAQALCATLFRCCPSSVTGPSVARWVGSPPSQASCEEFVAAASASQLDYIMSSIAAGRAKYAPDTTGACIARLRNLDCQAFRWPTESYLRASGCWSLDGQVAAGSPCFLSFECSRDGVCSGGSSARCEPGLQAGDWCDHYYSSPTGEASNCRRDLVCSHVCTVADSQPIGAPCTTATDCASRVCAVDVANKRQVCAPIVACGLR